MDHVNARCRGCSPASIGPCVGIEVAVACRGTQHVPGVMVSLRRKAATARRVCRLEGPSDRHHQRWERPATSQPVGCRPLATLRCPAARRPRRAAANAGRLPSQRDFPVREIGRSTANRCCRRQHGALWVGRPASASRRRAKLGVKELKNEGILRHSHMEGFRLRMVGDDAWENRVYPVSGLLSATAASGTSDDGRLDAFSAPRRIVSGRDG